jgi:CubicO group peptidase (beta-lactamase class C family)
MSETAGSWRQDLLDHVRNVIREDIARGRYFGAVIKVARGGEVGLETAIGDEGGPGTKPLVMDSVFSLFSATKAITNVLTFRAIERGQLMLTTKASEVIEEFSGGIRERITVFDLLTHASGLPSVFTPKPGMNIDRLDLVIAAICEHVHAVCEPQERVDYSPLCNHALLGEMVRRTDPKGRRYRDIAQQDVFDPLKMTSSAIGRPDRLKARHVVPVFGGNAPTQHPSSRVPGINGAFEDPEAEMPWVGAVCSVPDLFRFAEMLRRRGELDGARILSPAILELATRNWTGEKPNELYKAVANRAGWRPYPAYMGLGFAIRGHGVHHAIYGTLCSPATFGNYGAGSVLFWVDPVREITFAFLSAGVMSQAQNIERFQRICDIVSSAAV